MFRLADKLAVELHDGSRVLTVGTPLREAAHPPGAKRVRFDEIWRGYARFQWGHEGVFLHRMVVLSEHGS